MNRKFNLSFFIVCCVVLCSTAISVFAANTGRNVYGIYSETYNGAHIYDTSKNVGSDVDATKVYQWGSVLGVDGRLVKIEESSENVAEGRNFYRLKVQYEHDWDVVALTPVENISDVSLKDMSAYKGGAIKFLARSDKESFKTATVGFQYNKATSFSKTFQQLGFSFDGEWHEVSIPLNSETFANIDTALSAVSVYFMFQPNTLVNGDYIDIDNVRWIKPSGVSNTLSVTLKNVSDNSVASDQHSITWDEDVFRNGWKIANQYLEFNFDSFDWDFSGTNSFYVDIHTNSDKSGLVCQKEGLSEEFSVLPMSWRMVNGVLPYEYVDDLGNTIKATRLIGENIVSSTTRNLYDAGAVDGNSDNIKYATWFYMVDENTAETLAASTKEEEVDYVKILDLRKGGIHGSSDPSTAFWDLVNNKLQKCHPRLYFGANFDKALGGEGMQYTTGIVITLNYE